MDVTAARRRGEARGRPLAGNGQLYLPAISCQKHFQRSRLIADAQDYVVSLVTALRDEAEGPSLKVVLLADSVEQIRGVGTEAGQVHDSVVSLFSGQAASLALPMLALSTRSRLTSYRCHRLWVARWAVIRSSPGRMYMYAIVMATRTQPASQ